MTALLEPIVRLMMLWLLCLTACPKATFVLEPPPRLPDPVQTPDRPEIRQEAQGFQPSVSTDRTGSDRLGLQRRAVALAAAPHAGWTTSDDLIQALLNAGFRDVIDLTGADTVLAAWTQNGRTGRTSMVGTMPELLKVAPIHRSDALVYVHIEEVRSTQRRLPVRSWMAEEDVEVYEARRVDYERQVGLVQEELRTMYDAYRRTFERAKEAYEDARNPLQTMQDGMRAPEKYAWLDGYRAATRRRARQMPDMPDGPSLALEVASQDEENLVPVYSATADIRVVDGPTGRILTVFSVQTEASTLPVVQALLLDAIVDELGA